MLPWVTTKLCGILWTPAARVFSLPHWLLMNPGQCLVLNSGSSQCRWNVCRYLKLLSVECCIFSEYEIFPFSLGHFPLYFCRFGLRISHQRTQPSFCSSRGLGTIALWNCIEGALEYYHIVVIVDRLITRHSSSNPTKFLFLPYLYFDCFRLLSTAFHCTLSIVFTTISPFPFWFFPDLLSPLSLIVNDKLL